MFLPITSANPSYSGGYLIVSDGNPPGQTPYNVTGTLVTYTPTINISSIGEVPPGTYTVTIDLPVPPAAYGDDGPTPTQVVTPSVSAGPVTAPTTLPTPITIQDINLTSGDSGANIGIEINNPFDFGSEGLNINMGVPYFGDTGDE